ncbi:MAG TPA: tetratricopeptide repeat protein [Pyrinomonadaceae bacterium]|nr:tetratricopeptide repeat protein [Pyrinomonadaceae bacterium]
MKLQPRLAALAALACAACLSSAAPRAQGVARGRLAAQASPQPTPTPDKPRPNNASAVAQADSPAKAQPPVATREARAKAYAKLLEGQRYVSRAKSTGGISREGLATAQEAFREAARLDPALAEAHTALAEIAFFFVDDSAQAESEARAATKIDPDNFGAHRLLSRLYSLRAGLDQSKLKREDADKAISELKEVLRLDPTDAEALALLGEYYHLTGREAEAIEAFKRWVGAPATVDTRFYQVVTQGGELSSDSAQARLAEAYLRAGRTGEAVAAIRQALAAAPDNRNYLALLEEAIRQGGDTGGAIDELKRMVAANPADAEANAMLARAQARMGKTDDAVATLRAVLAKSAKGSKEQTTLTDALAQVLSDAMRYDEAIAAYEELLKGRGVTDAPLVADSDKQFAAQYLQEILKLQRQAGRDAAALATVERMRRLLGANDLMSEFYQIDLLREQGKRSEALAAVRAARLKYPENPSLLALEATTLAELGRVDEAATLMRSRLSGNFDDDFRINASVVQMLIEAKRGKEAVEAARKLIETIPADAPPRVRQDSLILLSSAQERAGDFKGAEESLRKILAADPTNATALNNLGYFLTEHDERLKEALEMIQKAVKAEPTNGSYLDSLGWVYFKLGQLDEAGRYLNDAALRSPRSATIHEHLGDLQQKRGNADQARASWRRALTLTTEPGETDRLKAKINGDSRR